MRQRTELKEEIQEKEIHHGPDSLLLKKIPGDNEYNKLRTEEKIKVLEMALKEFGDELDETERTLQTLKPQEMNRR